MEFKSENKYPSRLLAAGVLLILAAALLFILRFGKGGAAAKIVNTAVDGVNLTYFDFDENNQKKMEVRCLESRKYGSDRMLMKKITATIFKADKMEKDIRITAESGIVSSNLYNFEIHDQARIVSSDFLLTSQSFTLKNRELLSSRDKVDFKLKDIDGTASSGLDYFLNLTVLKLFSCKGTLIRDGQPYDFETRTFWVIKKDNLLVLQGDSELNGGGAIVRGDWISLQFDRDFAHLQTTFVSGNCFFQLTESGVNGGAQSKEISADLIYLTYDAAGRLEHIRVTGAGKITLQDKKNKGRVESDNTEIYLRAESQTLEKVHVRKRGTLSSIGQDNITVSGESLLAVYSPEGLLQQILADENCEFSTEDLRGTAGFITYDAGRSLIDISGQDAAMFSKKNVFNSSHFLFHTRKKKLSSDKGVKATIVPGKRNVLLSSKPLFITANAMEMTDRGNSIRFREKVKLFQDEIELHAGEMFFDGRRDLMSSSAGAELKFMNENELFVLRGQVIAFDTPGRKVVMTGNASLIQAENRLTGRQVELSFDRANRLENILARDNVAFNNKDLSGISGSLLWNFLNKNVLFKNSAQISRKGAGTTKGRELLLNLSSNEIKVSSQEDRAETTISQDRP
jgi:lipopolysaccharide export system protein LptA